MARYTIAHHPSRPERLALLDEDGKPAMWFAKGESADSIRLMLATQGFVCHEDGSLSK